MNKAYSRIVWENAPSVATPLNERNLNKVDVAVDEIDDRVVTLDGVKANQSDLLQSVKNVEYNEKSGVFRFNYWNGTYFEVDLNVEKIPVSFSMDENGVITMTNADGTTYTADISVLIKTYTFSNSANVAFTDTVDESGNHTITAQIVKGSITDDDLEGHYLANITLQADRAEQSADDADADRLEAEGFAVGTQNGVAVEEGSPYFANNAKYYSDRASEIAKVDIATTEKAGIVKPDGTSIHVKADGTIDCDGKADNMVYDEDNSLLYLKSGDKILSSVEISGGGAITVIHVDTHEEAWKGNENVLVEIFDDSKNYQGHFDENGDYFHKVQFLGDHLIRVTDEDGSIFEEHVNVDKLGSIYYVYVEKVTWGYKGWLESADISTSGYSSLADVLADEKVVRELMTKHASSDYLVSWLIEVPSEVDTFIGNDIAMKWIGLRDYVCDKLMAEYENEMLSSDHWERILKDHVPTMTSNTTPYGTVGASSTYASSDARFQPYASFNGKAYDAINGWVSTNTQTPHWIKYTFNSPICIKAVGFINRTRNASSDTVSSPREYEIQASNDDFSTYDVVYSNINTNNSEAYHWVDKFDNAKFYSSYRVYVKSVNTDGEPSSWNGVIISGLQFYGRSINGLVPIMRSNNEPYGECISGANDSYRAYLSFDGTVHGDTDPVGTAKPTSDSVGSGYVGYKLEKPTVVKIATFKPQYCDHSGWSAATITDYDVTYKIQASNDGSAWSDLTNEVSITKNDNSVKMVLLNNDTPYLYYRVWLSGTMQKFVYTTTQYWTRIQSVNFLGVDYSEREFAEGSTMKYLYDHGVELETIAPITVGNGVAEKQNDVLYFETPDANSKGFHSTESKIDFSPFKLARCVFADVGKPRGGTSANKDDMWWFMLTPNQTNSNYVAFRWNTKEDVPLNYSLDISSINAEYYLLCGLGDGNAGMYGTFNEIWLE